MNCMCDKRKLPNFVDCEPLKCAKILMSNDEEYIVKIDDLVAIQFIKNDEKILVRRGRIKDIIIVNKKQLSKYVSDNVSRIILDCSEQFTVKIIDIRLSDIIKIGGIDDEFDDYSDRETYIEPNFMKDNGFDGAIIPVREHGMITETEYNNKITKPHMDDVVKMNPDTGRFDDIAKVNDNATSVPETKKSITTKGFPLMR